LAVISQSKPTGDVVDFIEQPVVGRRANEVRGDVPAALTQSRMEDGCPITGVPQLRTDQTQTQLVDAPALLPQRLHVVAPDRVQQRPSNFLGVLVELGRRWTG